MRIHGRELAQAELEAYAGDAAAAGGVREVELSDGAERGIRVLEFTTAGGLRFESMIDRAMDIGVAEYRGVGVGWRSPSGFRHPGLHETDSEEGLSLFRSMSGLVVTAGLDHTLFGDRTEAAHYAYPPRTHVQHTLHGRVGNIPARLSGYGTRWDGDRAVLWAEGEIRQAAVFGEHLRLTRRIEAPLDGSEIRLIDVVRNHGFERTPHMFLYHVNVGWPLLEEGARFEAPVRETTWRSDSVGSQGADEKVMAAPRPGFVEQVYQHGLDADSEGRTRAAVVNDRLGLRFELDFSTREFPWFFEWLSLRAGSYAIGLEPSTHAVAGDNAARADGTMIWLEHGEERRYETVFRFAASGALAGDYREAEVDGGR